MGDLLAQSCSSYSGQQTAKVSTFDQLSCAIAEDVPSITVNASISFPTEIYISSPGVAFSLIGENNAVLSAQSTRLFNISASDVTFTNLALLGSSSTASSVEKGGLVFAQQTSLSFLNTSLSNGASLCGAALNLVSSQLLLSNSSVSNNAASSTQACGGALHLSSGSAELVQVLLTNNSGGQGGGIYVG
ncbi:hypothetical protein EON64_15670, partial [archaeon]